MKEPTICFWGSHCGHAILTMKLGTYHCPFRGTCFKRIKYDEKGRVQKEEGSK